MDEKKLTLARRVIAALRGDQDSYKVLFEAAAPDVWEIVKKYFRNDDDAKTAFDATFVTVAEKFADQKDPADYLGWVKRIAHLTSASQAAKVGGVADVEAKTLDYLPLCDYANEKNDGVLTFSTVKDLTDKLLNALPLRHRTELLLWNEGYSVAEIAKKLNLAPAAVAGGLNAAKATVEKEVEGFAADGIDYKEYAASPIGFFTRLMREKFDGSWLYTLPEGDGWSLDALWNGLQGKLKWPALGVGAAAAAGLVGKYKDIDLNLPGFDWKGVDGKMDVDLPDVDVKKPDIDLGKVGAGVAAGAAATGTAAKGAAAAATGAAATGAAATAAVAGKKGGFKKWLLPLLCLILLLAILAAAFRGCGKGKTDLEGAVDVNAPEVTVQAPAGEVLTEGELDSYLIDADVKTQTVPVTVSGSVLDIGTNDIVRFVTGLNLINANPLAYVNASASPAVNDLEKLAYAFPNIPEILDGTLTELKYTDRLGQEMTFTFDVVDDLLNAVTLSDATGSETDTATYNYDKNGTLSTISIGNKTLNYAMDTSATKVQEDAVNGLTKCYVGDNWATCRKNAAGNIDLVTYEWNGKTGTRAFAYDNDGALTTYESFRSIMG